MPTYHYTAKSGPGHAREGDLIADSEADALARLEAMGYTPIRLREQALPNARRHARPVGRRDITVFTRQMAGLLKAGVPMLRALATVAAQADKYRGARLIESLADAVRNGVPLSTALSEHPHLFSSVYISMVRAGESAGALDRVLRCLAEVREKEDAMRQRVQAAIAYPLLLLGVGAVTVFVLLAFFMPRVIVLFEGLERLPWPTRLLLAISGWVSRYRFWILLVSALPVVLIHRLTGFERGRLWMDRLLLRMPLVKSFLLFDDVARFSRTLALLITAGVPISGALTLAAATLQNRVLRDEIEAVRDATVQQGRAFSEGLRRARYFPPFLATMTAVGEEGGRIEETLDETALYYERETDRMGQLVSALLEPVLILTVGALVGFIVAAMLLPIFELGTAGL